MLSCIFRRLHIPKKNFALIPIQTFAIKRTWTPPTTQKVSKADEILKNARILYPEVRVVYEDDNGETTWKILTRREALDMARAKSLDLVLSKYN
jgi:hypothetical protein